MTVYFLQKYQLHSLPHTSNLKSQSQTFPSQKQHNNILYCWDIFCDFTITLPTLSITSIYTSSHAVDARNPKTSTPCHVPNSIASKKINAMIPMLHAHARKHACIASQTGRAIIKSLQCFGSIVTSDTDRNMHTQPQSGRERLNARMKSPHPTFSPTPSISFLQGLLKQQATSPSTPPSTAHTKSPQVCPAAPFPSPRSRVTSSHRNQEYSHGD